ncbi:MAG: transcription elongation factor GreA [bacterium]
MNEQIISQDGYNKLKDELEYLQKVKRKEIADRIESAKELGDLSENAEYAEAKEAQGFNESRIAEIYNTLKLVTVVDNGSKGEIGMNSKVTAKVNGEKKDFTIVSFNEADPFEGKISNESPIGIALLGKKKGDTAIVKTPRGEVEYKIVSVD